MIVEQNCIKWCPFLRTPLKDYDGMDVRIKNNILA